MSKLSKHYKCPNCRESFLSPFDNQRWTYGNVSVFNGLCWRCIRCGYTTVRETINDNLGQNWNTMLLDEFKAKLCYNMHIEDFFDVANRVASYKNEPQVTKLKYTVPLDFGAWARVLEVPRVWANGWDEANDGGIWGRGWAEAIEPRILNEGEEAGPQQVQEVRFIPRERIGQAIANVNGVARIRLGNE